MGDGAAYAMKRIKSAKLHPDKHARGHVIAFKGSFAEQTARAQGLKLVLVVNSSHCFIYIFFTGFVSIRW